MAFIKNAAVLTQYLADIVKDLDKDNSQLYKDNADAYINKLAGLDSDYEMYVRIQGLRQLYLATDFHSGILLMITELIIMPHLQAVQQKQRQV